MLTQKIDAPSFVILQLKGNSCKSFKCNPKYSDPKFKYETQYRFNHFKQMQDCQKHFLTSVDQIAIIDFQLGSDWNDGQFLGNCIFDLEALSEICFSWSTYDGLVWQGAEAFFHHRNCPLNVG